MNHNAVTRTGHSASHEAANELRIRRLGIDTYQEAVLYMHKDCPVCKSEGFEAQSRIKIILGEKSVIATLNVVTSSLLGIGELGLSEAAWRALGGREGDTVLLQHPEPIKSFSAVRAKIYGNKITEHDANEIIADIVKGKYSDIQLASFVSACADDRLDLSETIALTRAMLNAGSRLEWDNSPIVDKHCVGGLPGNRTTPIVVAIAAACGLTIPKTSSRAITSPAGTADAMETMAPIDLNIEQMRRVVAQEGGCIAWGGAVSLSPADDILIRVERPLDLDSNGQLVASVLSKKIAAGSTHVLIDIPVGLTAKVRSEEAAVALSGMLVAVGTALGIEVRTIITDGSQPIGRGIGPALEARDVLAVLQNQEDAPSDLRQRALLLSGHLLEMGGKAAKGKGLSLAENTLVSGAAWRKFQAICAAQGGMRTPPQAGHTAVIVAQHSGQVIAIDNRRLARIAKLAGAPKAPAAGLTFHVPLGTIMEAGQPLFTIHAESPGELAYARQYAEGQSNVVVIKGDA